MACMELRTGGILFIKPGTKVYEGMVIGSSPKNMDIEINVCRKKTPI